MDRSRRAVLDNLAAVHERLAAACERSGRDPRDVRLVAVGKSVEASVLCWVREAGVEDLGENYVQELRRKWDQVPDARWHFIGTLQASGAHHVAELADWVQTVVPGTAASRLARRAAGRGRRIPALVEVDFTGGRTGVAPDDVVSACDEVAATDGLALRGLMTLPPPTPDAEGARPFFRRLRGLLGAVSEHHPEATELSMGMSLDYEVAVEEGATMVRIGTALFGVRPSDRGRT
ncbi:MAG TPA: YggS family pyridoxal phosphate-dependent enzyme [Actinomycetota bacterium]|nr:YggS family pyridoxal phosphate-dependent enzyme [Actinomycetota bacterium]